MLVLGYFSSNICRTMKPDIFTIHDRPIGPRHVDITPTVGRSRLVPDLAHSQLRMVIRLILQISIVCSRNLVTENECQRLYSCNWIWQFNQLTVLHLILPKRQTPTLSNAEASTQAELHRRIQKNRPSAGL